jgi:hypothetical protein
MRARHTGRASHALRSAGSWLDFLPAPEITQDIHMHRIPLRLATAACLVAATCCFSATASAQATRTWVSGVGDDVNPCSRTAPCKTFAGAISKTAAGGEINALDSGGFGGVTITKSITINAVGVIAGVLVAGTNGITVNAGPTDVVQLRGLDINGVGTGINGINFIAGGALHVEDSVIYGFTGEAILIAPSPGSPVTSEFYVNNTSMRKNAGGGIRCHPGPNGTVKGEITNARMEGDGHGVRAEDNCVVFVRDSVAAGGDSAGFNAVSTSTPALLTVEGSSSVNNQMGVRASGAGATLRIGNVTIMGNSGLGISNSGGSIITLGGNRVSNNAGGNGSPTGSEGTM